MNFEIMIIDEEIQALYMYHTIMYARISICMVIKYGSE